MEAVIGIIVLSLATVTIVLVTGPEVLRRPWLIRLIPGLDPRHFASRIHETEDPEIVLHFQICGRIHAPRAGLDTQIRILVQDVTDPNEHRPILTRNRDLQQEGGLEFCYTLDNGPLPSKVSILKDWVEFFSIPCAELVFPREGYRTLEAAVSVIAREDGRVLAEARSQILTLSQQPGYESIQRNRIAKRRAVTELAAAVWVLGGRHPDTRARLAARLNEKFAAAPGETDTVESILAETLSCPPDDAIVEACRSIRDVAAQSECLDTLTLCIETVGASEVISDETSRLLSLIADNLGISPQRFHALRQKILSRHSDKMADPRRLLGIDDSMSGEEILRQLTKEYRKWNARVTHADESVRRQADQMLNLIMELRSRYQHCA